MISISIEAFFTLAICLSVLLLLLLWGRQFLRVATRHWEPSELKICQCPKCHYDFFIKPRRVLVVCPACKERVRVRSNANAKHIRY